MNRRERIATGEVILGYSPSGPCDRAVSVLRFELDDRVATVVNFACHPTVLGPDTLEASSTTLALCARPCANGLAVNACFSKVARAMLCL